jgi:predicted nuclease of predicted toxin-antitoxin system
MSLSFRADEHVDSAIVTALEAEGYAVGTVGDEYGRGLADEAHLAECRQRGRIILTNDDDFAVLGREMEHAGIIRYSNQGRSPGEFVRAIRRIDTHLSTREMTDHVEWLGQWL